jgi:hypothetical protein
MSDNAETQKEFYGHLATELINNNYNIVRGRDLQSARNPDDEVPAMICASIGGIGPHITPTKLLLTDNNATKLTHRCQGRCRWCSRKTTHHCSVCIDSPEIKDLGWIRDTKKGKTCFAEHLLKCHP